VLTVRLCASGVGSLDSGIRVVVNSRMDIREIESKGGKKVELALNHIK
jgi:hypothetical protein